MGDSYKHFQGFVYASKHTRVGDTKKIQDLGIQTHVRLLDTNTHIQDLEVQKTYPRLGGYKHMYPRLWDTNIDIQELVDRNT